MPLKLSSRYSRTVKQTLHWLIPSELVDHPENARGESQYLLQHARRLHDSLTRLPPAVGLSRRCLVVGSWGLEVPYLMDMLGWRDVICLCPPNSRPGIRQKRRRVHPNGTKEYEFTLIEHDLESGAWPFEDESFDLAVYWGCLERMRHDPEFSLYELNRVCAPGATASLLTDNAVSFRATHSLLRGEPMPMRLHWPAAQVHWRHYSPREVAELLEGTGWRVDMLTSIVPDPPVYWKWWKRWLFRRIVAGQRRGFGLSEPFWNAFLLAHAVKVAPPTRNYPSWLYMDEKVRRLKMEMIEMVSRRPGALVSA